MATDRNQQAHDEFAAARARKQFQDAYAAGAAGLVDRLGTMLQDGDLVVYTPDIPILFELRAIGPTLDPRVRAGVMKYELVATVPLLSQANQPVRQIMMVRRPERSASTTVDEGQAPPGPPIDYPPPPNEPGQPPEGADNEPDREDVSADRPVDQ